MGTAYKALLPYQTFRTKTRDLALAVGSEKLWKAFCPAIGRPEPAGDPRYRTNADRRETATPSSPSFRRSSYPELRGLGDAAARDGIPMGRSTASPRSSSTRRCRRAEPSST